MLRSSLRVLCSSLLLSVCLGSAQAQEGRFAVGPDSNLELFLDAMRSARSKIQLNIYQFDETPVLDLLKSRIRSGVTLHLLIEGEPVGGISNASKAVLSDLLREMRASRNPNHRIFVMQRNADGRRLSRRFVYDHAKYAVLDDSRVWISSDNLTKNGHAAPGSTGNRGWDALLAEPTLAAQMGAMFAQDTSTEAGDIVAVLPDGRLPWANSEISGNVRVSQVRTVPAAASRNADVTGVKLVTSPRSAPGLTEMMANATKTFEIETMSLPHQWRRSAEDVFLSPLVESLVLAARRGVQVRVLLNDERAFDSADRNVDADRPKPNEMTVSYLQRLARCYKLPLAARIIDVDATQITYIHNKGMLADDDKVLVSSINGTRNSVENNRETAAVIQSAGAHEYFSSVFDSDWSLSPVADSAGDCPALPGNDPVSQYLGDRLVRF